MNSVDVTRLVIINPGLNRHLKRSTDRARGGRG